MKIKNFLAIIFANTVLGWDISKSFPKCDGGEKGYSVSGIFTYSHTNDGKYVINAFNGKSKTTCDADVCGCGISASGSLFPPKYSSIHCKGVINTAEGKKRISFPSNRGSDKLSEPHKICCDKNFFGLIKAGCHVYN